MRKAIAGEREKGNLETRGAAKPKIKRAANRLLEERLAW